MGHCPLAVLAYSQHPAIGKHHRHGSDWAGSDWPVIGDTAFVLGSARPDCPIARSGIRSWPKRETMLVKLHSMQASDCASCGVRDRSLFADLTTDDFRLITQPIHDLTIAPHSTLFAQGATGEHVITVRKGLVKLVRYQTDGSQRIVRLIGPGDIAGLETTAGAAYDSTAIALTEVQACKIPRAVIQRLEAESPRMHQQLVRKWHEALKAADDFIADLASGNARQRLARLLLRLAAAQAQEPLLLPPREDVGAMLGITTETASRTVAAFRREGLLHDLDRQGRFFRIDAAALHAVADRHS